MKNHGFSLAEMAIVLVIVSIIGYQVIKGSASTKTDREIDEIVNSALHVKNKIVGHFADKRTYTALSEEYAYSNGLYYPIWSYDNAAECKTGYGRNCAIGTLKSGMYPSDINFNDGFFISIENIPTNFCESILTVINDGFEGIAIGSVAFKSHTTAYSLSNMLNGCEELKKKTNVSTIILVHY